MHAIATDYFRRTVMATLLLTGALALAGCGSGETVGPGVSPPPPGNGGGNTNPGTLSLAADLQPLLTARYAFAGCHGGSAPQQGLDLTAGNAHENLVNQPSTEVPDRMRVVPGDPDASYLLEKVSQPNPTEGSRMPLGSSPLTEEEIQTIRDWIAQGAAP